MGKNVTMMGFMQLIGGDEADENVNKHFTDGIYIFSFLFAWNCVQGSWTLVLFQKENFDLINRCPESGLAGGSSPAS